MEKTLVGAYIRLSRESDYSDSNSISNQCMIIEEFCKHANLKIVDYYIDDGYTGTNFDRPAFKRLFNDIDDKKINCIIVKDLSRFGRNSGWVQVYLDELLPMIGVRFISINDNLDSKTTNISDSMEAKFLSFAYEYHAIENSKKIKQLKHMQQKNGDYIGVSAPYGYLKDPNDNHKLIIDDYAANIVKRIFVMTLELKSRSEIADILNNENIYPPSKYKAEVTKVTSSKTKISSEWNPNMVREILKNEVYIGNTVQGKVSKPQRKLKTIIKKKKDDWIVVENTHEAIIPKDDFNKVQNIFNYSKAVLEGNDILLRYLKCHECGNSFYRNKSKGNVYYYCYSYRKKNCSSHSINKEILEKMVLEHLKEKDNKIKELNKKILNKYVKYIYIYDNGNIEIKYID